jgi:hypothetical protein
MGTTPALTSTRVGMAALRADEGADVGVDTGMGMMDITGMHTHRNNPTGIIRV